MRNESKAVTFFTKTALSATANTNRRRKPTQSGVLMAIQPIDLQTLYSQLGNVSKTVAFQQQGVPLQNAIQQEEQTKRLQQKREAVEAASGYDEGPAGVKTIRKALPAIRKKRQKSAAKTKRKAKIKAR